jgi:hypothetical protein
MLPEPVREDKALGVGQPVIQRGRYAIEHIEIERARIQNGRAHLRVGRITMANGSVSATEISTRERVAKLDEVWSHARDFPDEIAEVLTAHRDTVQSGGPILPAAENLVRRIATLTSAASADLNIVYSEQTDVVEALAAAIKLEVPAPTLTVDEVDPEELEVKRRTVKEWKRWANARGPKSAIFREQVRNAYQATCVICGVRFPPTPFSVTGVDAAHILPWRDYDLDDVRNGLCLCKIHHWAFDEGLLVIIAENGTYETQLPSDVEAKLRALGGGFSLAPLESSVGVIPTERLPARRSQWPDPELLRRLNEAQE